MQDIQRELEEMTEEEDDLFDKPAQKEAWGVKHAIKVAFKSYDKPPRTELKFYKIGRILGKGAYGKVNLARQKLSNKLLAVKSVCNTYLRGESGERAFARLRQEIALLEDIRHPNIVKLYETLTPQACDKPYHLMFMELCAGGDLLQFVRKRRYIDETLVK